MKRLRSKRHAAKQTIVARLSAGERAKIDRIVAVCIPATVFFWMACFNYVITRLWHWPFFAAYYIGPWLSGVLTLIVIFAPILGLLSWVSAAKKAERKRVQTNDDGQDVRLVP